MNALIMMLKNTAKNTFHPIMYFENLLPGGYESEGNQKLIRYKSKGHHTTGFSDRQEAINSLDELEEKTKSIGYETIHRELDGDVEWNGEGIPADVQIRNRN